MTNPEPGAPPAEDCSIARATAHMHALNRSQTTRMQRAMDCVMALVGWPGSAVALALAMAAWLAFNLAGPGLGLDVPDPPPFIGLHIAAATVALVLAALIFTTQRREDLLARHRAQLIMELAILADQKTSKIIELIEESRRDNPAIADRIDSQAEQMSSPSDPEAVLIAIKDIPE